MDLVLLIKMEKTLKLFFNLVISSSMMPFMEHWRPPFPGNDDDVDVQIFQHYVFLNGKFEGEIFDKKNNATSVEISNDLKSQIFLSKGVFTKKECKKIIKRAIKVDDWEPQQTVGKHEGVRVCEGWFIPK